MPSVTTQENDLRFPGQWADGESKLLQNWHRDYDPSLGRYIQADPIGLAAGQSLYGYVGGDPVNFVDSMGLFKNCAEFQAAGGGACTDQLRLTDNEGVISTVVVGMRVTEIPNRRLANMHYLSQDGLPICIPVSSFLQYTDVDFEASATSTGGRIKYFGIWDNSPESKVLGTVETYLNSDGHLYIKENSYDFDIQDSMTTFRDWATYYGDPGKFKPIEEGGFMFQFQGMMSKTGHILPSNCGCGM